MKENWSNKQTEFWSRGYTIFDNLFPEELLLEWKKNVEWLSKNSEAAGVNRIDKEYTETNIEARDDKGLYRFTSIDGRANSEFKGLKNYYHCLSHFLSILSGLDIVESSDFQSAITFMHYKSGGSTLTHHFDTNFLTLLLYLTDNEDGGTQIQPLNTLRPTLLGCADEVIGEPIIILPKFGRVVAFLGRKVWHGSLPSIKSDKISVVFNYYENGDGWRPKEISERLYK